MRAATRGQRQLYLTSIGLVVAIAAGLTAYFANPAQALASGEPVITSLTVTDQGSGVWKVSGSISASDYSGMTIHFGGSVIDETEDVDANGNFDYDYSMSPVSGDWA